VTGDSAGRVVLDLGEGVGALVLYAPAELEGTEIEVSPFGRRGEPVAVTRTHARVRRREAGGAPSYAAVYQELADGNYVVWRDRDTPAGSVVITGGEVTIWRLPGPATGDYASGG
jgi:hypothetical protein